MYYLVKNNKVYSYSDLDNMVVPAREYPGLTVEQYEAEPDRYKIVNGKLYDRIQDEDYLETHLDKIRKDLIEFTYEAKEAKAYGGITIKIGDNEALFETTKEAMAPIVATLISLPNEDSVTHWKFWEGEVPTTLPITKKQLQVVLAFGKNMVDDCFRIEGESNEKVKSATKRQLMSSKWVEDFKNVVTEDMNKVNTLLVL